jgi:hypothetical protein
LTKWVSVALVLVAATGVAACGPPAGGSIRDGRDQGKSAEALKGTWVLAEFEPEVEFEPMLVSLLEAQIGTLLLTFDGQTMTAKGPGIDVTRSYEVVQSLFERVDIVIFGDDGTTYEIIGRFIGDDLQFESRSTPWTGKGRLTRP